MATLNQAQEPKKDLVSDIALYILGGGLVISLIVGVVYVILGYFE